MTHCYVHAFRSNPSTPLGCYTLGTKITKIRRLGHNEWINGTIIIVCLSDCYKYI